MLKIENRIADFINKYMVWIGLGFVFLLSLWARFKAIEYVGQDFHYHIYDLPGNRNSWLYRYVVAEIMERSEHIVAFVKSFAYVGDYLVAFLMVYIIKNGRKDYPLVKQLFLYTAFLLSPFVLMNSIGGMRLDSLGFAFILFAYICYTKNKYLLSVSCVLISTLYPVFWIFVPVALYFILKKCIQNSNKIEAVVSVTLSIVVLVITILVEKSSGTGYFFGKQWVIEPFSGQFYTDFFDWIRRMVYDYLYLITSGLLILAIKNKKLRLPIVLILAVLFFIFGWYRTCRTAI